MNGTGRARERMLERHLRDRGIDDARVLDAMSSVPREAFVSTDLATNAYDDRPLPIAEGQTISQPYIVAFMAQAAAITPGARVLEVGTGSGYGAAVLGRLAGSVDTIERYADLATTAAERLGRLEYANVRVHVGDGTRGWPDAAPFDAIVVTASGPAVPAPLQDQLAIGGRLVMPLERRHGHQQLVAVTRVTADEFAEQALLGVAFVPLVGEHGHPE